MGTKFSLYNSNCIVIVMVLISWKKSLCQFAVYSELYVLSMDHLLLCTNLPSYSILLFYIDQKNFCMQVLLLSTTILVAFLSFAKL